MTVFWRDWDTDSEVLGLLEGPPVKPLVEGCPVRVTELRRFLESAEIRARLWDDDRGDWERVHSQQITPGMVVMLPARAGGYDRSRGWTGDPKDRPQDVLPPGPGRAYADEHRSELGYWCGLVHHLADAEHHAEMLVESLALPDELSKAVVWGARWHDLGKAHRQWQDKLPALEWLERSAAAALRSVTGSESLAKIPAMLRARATPAGVDAISQRLAELPQVEVRPLGQRQANGLVEAAWLIDHRLTRPQLESLRNLLGVQHAAHVPFRPGMRHEAATALAMWARYRDGQADWPALAVYLAAAHHGKVRTTMRARSAVGDRAGLGNDVCGVPRASVQLNLACDDWPMDFSVATDGADGEWTEDGFLLTGYGWTGLVADLLGSWRGDDAEPWRTGAVRAGEPRALGPFRLAYLEALVRVADWRASADPSHPVKIAETPQ